MDEQEIIEKMTNLQRKVDKLLNIVTKMGKALHLIEVTEKEERDIQLLQRKNMALYNKVADELDSMSPDKPSDTPEMLTIFDQYKQDELFGDVLGDDFLGGNNNGR